MVPTIIVVAVILAIAVGLMLLARPRAVQVIDGDEDASGTKYRCAICERQQVRVSGYHEHCVACGFSTKQTYDGVLKERINLLRDINSAIPHFESADFQLGGSDPNLQKYATELAAGIALIDAGSPVIFALLDLEATVVADQLKRMITEEGNFESRAERYLKLLPLAKEVFSQNIQRHLRALETEPPKSS